MRKDSEPKFQIERIFSLMLPSFAKFCLEHKVRNTYAISFLNELMRVVDANWGETMKSANAPFRRIQARHPKRFNCIGRALRR